MALAAWRLELLRIKMHVGIPKRSTVWALRVSGVVFIALSCALWHLPGLGAALIVAFVVDRLWPKWASDLSWDDIAVALCNLSSFGVNGSRLHLRLPDRKLLAYKDTKAGKKRLAVMLFTAEWNDLFSSDRALKQFAKEMDAVCYIERAYRQEACILKPKDESRMDAECFRLLKRIFELSGKSLGPDTISCVDSITRYAWRKYDDVNYDLG